MRLLRLQRQGRLSSSVSLPRLSDRLCLPLTSTRFVCCRKRHFQEKSACIRQWLHDLISPAVQYSECALRVCLLILGPGTILAGQHRCLLESGLVAQDQIGRRAGAGCLLRHLSCPQRATGVACVEVACQKGVVVM